MHEYHFVAKLSQLLMLINMEKPLINMASTGLYDASKSRFGAMNCTLKFESSVLHFRKYT
ncbi:hypothetical protein T11_9750 [Trichinella zimbabwensis]|uniref:Uncharacterized protein n=1 Tax=Trichinella zimbabwensis TaxID=268475 RepID=A0A0V1GV22_9BILA|nr:hypothetical protein T11_9750 [Trichinella zimbabwensis]